jgi:hypothetical protein
MIVWNDTAYADALVLVGGQGDPLDLASTNERLYNRMFPGFNNAVRYIRVYSALCWMAKQAHAHLDRAGPLTKRQMAEVVDLAMQKMELALMWANGLNAELAGKTRPFPTGNAPQRLTINQWSIQARLMSPVQYKPSITNGLGFLAEQTWEVTDDFGEGLADAFEALLLHPGGHRWLRDVTCHDARKSDIARAALALSVLGAPSGAEQQAFMKSFFPVRQPRVNAEDQSVRMRQRWSSLHLVLITLDKLQEERARCDNQAIRSTMASGVTPSSSSVISPGLEPTQALWAVLQIRLLQRLALESVLAFVIDWVSSRDRTGQRPADCAEALGIVAQEAFSKKGVMKNGDLHRQVRAAQGSSRTLSISATAGRQGRADIYRLMGQLRSYKRGSSSDSNWLRLALTSLAVCAVEADNFQQFEHHSWMLNQMDRDRNSLKALLVSFTRDPNMPLSRWTQDIVMHWVFAQYSSVATQRAVLPGGKLRFDFIEGEFGLELGPPRASRFRATWQADKLETAMILLAQCGLVDGDAGGWKLTRNGRQRVRQYAANATKEALV